MSSARKRELGSDNRPFRQHGMAETEQLGGLGHEVHAGQHDDVGIHLGGFAR